LAKPLMNLPACEFSHKVPWNPSLHSLNWPSEGRIFTIWEEKPGAPGAGRLTSGRSAV